MSQGAIRRRLILRPGAIGDVIVSLPALESLRAPYTEVWTNGAVTPLIYFADRARPLAGSGLDLLEIPDAALPVQLIEYLQSFDSIVSWYGANRAEFPRVVEALGLPVRLFRALPLESEKMHACDYYAGQVRSLGIRVDAAVPRIPVEPEPAPSPYAVLHPFSGNRRKNWPLARYGEVAAALRPKLKVFWCAEPGAGLAGAVQKENLGELARWLAGAAVYVGNDSGISHLAAAVGTPVVALFGPTSPDTWAPRGPLVRVVQPETRPGPMEAIRTEAVLEAVAEVLRGSPLKDGRPGSRLTPGL